MAARSKFSPALCGTGTSLQWLLFFCAATALLFSPAVVVVAEEKVPGSSYDVILSEVGPSKIAVIKEVRDAVPGMGLAEAKTLVESAPKPIRRGVTEAEAGKLKARFEAVGAKVAVESGGVAVTLEPSVTPAAPPLEEKASYDVILADMGPSKIAVIKAVRDSIPGLGLAETKALVERAPTPIKLGVMKAEAEAIKRKVESAGATVLIK